MSIFPKHPFPMETVFKTCFLANFEMEPHVLAKLLPDPLEPDIRNGKAYLSVVVSELMDMRPTFFPKGFGFNFNQIVYRAIVKCNGERGVHFLRSDADNKIMCIMGNLFSFFHFNYSAVSYERVNNHFSIEVKTKSGEADINARYNLANTSNKMPSGSAFPDLEEAKNYFVELYVAFSATKNHSTAVRINRTNWNLSVVGHKNSTYMFMEDSAMFPGYATRLDSVFYVENLFYHWHTLEKTAKSFPN